jgi:hypothetical protein
MNGLKLSLGFLLMLVFLSSAADADWVEARIDQSCFPVLGIIDVPVGLIASNLKFADLTSGNNCVGGGTPEIEGFSILSAVSAQAVYRYSRSTSGGIPTEWPMPLSKFRLGPGRYELSVGGGRGAHVTLSWSLT